jgi:hypothetical protein
MTTRYLRFLPLLALPLLGWWALARLGEESAMRFAAAQALLEDERVLRAGAVELAGCGSNGCADWRDNVYRLGGGKGDCFLFQGRPGEGDIGTGILVGGRGEAARLVLLDLEGAGVRPLGERAIARAACPAPAARR